MSEGERYAGGVFLFAAGCVAGWLWAIRPGLLAEIEWLQVMTAFGTVGAVLTALYFSSLASNLHKRDRRLRADMALARALPELRRIVIGLSMCRYQLVAMTRTAEGSPYSSNAPGLIRQLLDDLGTHSMSGLLEDLMFSENGEGIRAAEFVGGAKRLRSYCETVLSLGDTAPNGGDVCTFMALQEVCRLGALADDILGTKGDPNRFRQSNGELARIVFGDDFPFQAL